MERTPDQIRYDFELRTRFISNYLSREIRGYRFSTDGTFNQIHVGLVEDEPGPTRIVPLSALFVEITYDREKYERIKGTDNCEFYLSLLDEGFRKAADFKKIPLEELVHLIEEFRQAGCKNEWIHQKKRFKEIDISVALNCYFTTNDFKLAVNVDRISTKSELCNGVILRTDPDEVCFQGLFKDILIRSGKIVITDVGDSPKFLIDLKEALSGVLSFERMDIGPEEMAANFV